MSKGELPLIFVQINFHKAEDYELDHYDLYDVNDLDLTLGLLILWRRAQNN